MGQSGIILDFDGTIVDSGPIFTSCMNELGKEFGYKKIEAGPGLREESAHEIFTRRLGLSPERLNHWTVRFKALLKQRMVAAKPFKGMKEVFGHLITSYRVGILTSNSEEVVRHIFRNHGFGAVDFVSCEAPILEKDRALHNLMKCEGLLRDETVYIGDEVRDIDACRQVGIPIVAVTWGFNSRAALEKRDPDYLADSPEQLLKLLTGGRIRLSRLP
jgi:phosphoglycolate phosphatase